MFSTRSISIFDLNAFTGKSPIKYNEILPFALYLCVCSSVHTFTPTRTTKKSDAASGDLRLDMHAFWLYSFRSNRHNNNKDLGGLKYTPIKLTDLFTGTKRDKEHYQSPSIRGLVILSRLFWFGLKLLPELTIRSIDIVTEKLAVDSYQFMKNPNNNSILRVFAGATALAISSILVPAKITSICLRSITSHEEVWQSAKMIDMRLWPKTNLLGVGPVEFLARSLTFIIITAATIIFPPLIPKTAPVLVTALAPILKPIISLAKPVLGPILKPIGAFCAKSIANPLTKTLTSTPAKAIATATKSTILAPLTTLVIAPIKYLQNKLNNFLFGEYKPTKKNPHLFRANSDDSSTDLNIRNASLCWESISNTSEDNNEILPACTYEFKEGDFSIARSRTSSNASISSQLSRASSDDSSVKCNKRKVSFYDASLYWESISNMSEDNGKLADSSDLVGSRASAGLYKPAARIESHENIHENIKRA